MKTLNYLIAGMIGLGSFGIFENARGQEIEKDTAFFSGFYNPQKEDDNPKKPMMLQVTDENKDSKIDCYELRIDFGDSVHIVRYNDKNFDEKFDKVDINTFRFNVEFSKATYSTYTILDEDDGLLKMLESLKKFSIGEHYQDCEKGYFEKKFKDFWK